jgi:hypothetical protein
VPGYSPVEYPRECWSFSVGLERLEGKVLEFKMPLKVPQKSKK